MREIHQYRITKEQLREAVMIIIQFGVRFDLLDQTILHALTYFECYLAKNANAMPFFLREIALIAVEIAIKNNEDKVLSLEECVYMIDKIGVSANSELNKSQSSGGSGGSSEGKIEKFTVKMFGALERHMLLLIKFKINVPTALDFALFFAHRAFPREDAQWLVHKCSTWLYYVAINHEVGRYRKPSAIALAALCHVIQNT